MAGPLIVVKAARGEEARVWFAGPRDMPGPSAEADTRETLVGMPPAMVRDLTDAGAPDDAGGGGHAGGGLPIAHASTRRPARAAA